MPLADGSVADEIPDGDMASDDIEWRRLHPVTVIRELIGLAWNFIGAIALSGFAPDVGGGPIANIETLLPAAVVALGFVRYLFTTYAVTDDAVLYRRGVVVRQRTVLPRPRIQNVAIGADLVARVFSMQTLTISSAGSEGEIELAVVSKETARTLLGELTAQPAAGAAVPLGSTPGDDAVLAPTVPGSVPVGPPLVGPVPSAQPEARVVRYQLSPRNHLLYAFSSSTVAVGLVSVVVAAVMMVFFESAFPLFWMFGLIVPIVAVLDLFGFVFEVEPRRVRVSHGLFSTQEKWAQKRRIQLIEVRRPWIRHRLGRETLAVATADVTESRGGRFELCAPIIDDNTWSEFLPDLIDPDAADPIADAAAELVVDPIDEASLQRVSRVSIRRRAIRSAVAGLIPVAVLTFSAFGIQESSPDFPVDVAWWWPLVLVPFVLGISLWFAWRSWRVDGWLLRGPCLAVRRGRFDETLRIVWVSKVQGVFLRSSFFQRRLGLASLAIDTANLGSATVIPDLPIDVAQSLAADLAATADRVWLPDGV